MVMGLWSRIRGGDGGASQLEADLRRITESETIDAPKETLAMIVQASHNQEDRLVIMTHLQTCMAEANGKRWRRVYGALVLVEHLLQRGSPELVAETADGLHFDLVQRLTFLSRFSFEADKRVEGIIREKAGQLRTELLDKQELAEDGASGSKEDGNRERQTANAEGGGGRNEAPRARDPVIDERPSGGWDVQGTRGGAAGGGPPPSGPRAVQETKGRMVLDGVVSVGHRDDTSSESEGERAARRSRKDTKKKERRRREDSTDSDASSDDRRPRGRRSNGRRGAGRDDERSPAPAPAPAPSVDLLDF